MQQKVTAQIGATPISIETGKIARLADGAVVVTCGDTMVLVSAVSATAVKEGQDFFPLTVDYREKAAAAGKFPGGYFKREGRPTEKEILTSRLIDRPIRPLFPKGWYNEYDLVMFEGSAKEISDADFNAALKFAHEAIQPMITAQRELVARAGKQKREITLNIVPQEILAEAKAYAAERIVDALLTPGKMAREAAVSALADEVGRKLVEKFGEEKVTEFVLKDAFYYVQKEAVRNLVMGFNKRLDGRDFDQIR